MGSRLLALALLLMPATALADVKDKVAALDPSAVVLVVDAKGEELVAQNADEPFVPASVTKIVTAWLAMEASGRPTIASKPASTSTPSACSMCAAAAIRS